MLHHAQKAVKGIGQYVVSNDALDPRLERPRAYYQCAAEREAHQSDVVELVKVQHDLDRLLPMDRHW